jgi:hypothetical protein
MYRGQIKVKFSNLQQRKMYDVKSQKSTYSSNQDALGFGKSIAPQIKHVCQSLHCFGITMFTYSRIFRTGERLYLCNNQEWFEHYIKNDYQDDADHLEHYIPADGVKTALWNGFKMDKVFSAAYDQFDLWHGFSIYEKQNDYVDFFDFAAHKDNHQMVQFYFNNLDQLEKFVRDFKEVSLKWVEMSKPNHLLIPKNLISFEQIQRNSFITAGSLEDFLQNSSTECGYQSHKTNSNLNVLKNIIKKDWEFMRFNAIN